MFTIAKLEFVGSGKFIVGGRNCKDELRTGDHLIVDCAHISNKIEVVIDEIEMYNKKVDEVPAGLTAGLLFKNEIAGYFSLGGTIKGKIE